MLQPHNSQLDNNHQDSHLRSQTRVRRERKSLNRFSSSTVEYWSIWRKIHLLRPLMILSKDFRVWLNSLNNRSISDRKCQHLTTKSIEYQHGKARRLIRGD